MRYWRGTSILASHTIQSILTNKSYNQGILSTHTAFYLLTLHFIYTIYLAFAADRVLSHSSSTPSYSSCSGCFQVGHTRHCWSSSAPSRPHTIIQGSYQWLVLLLPLQARTRPSSTVHLAVWLRRLSSVFKSVTCHKLHQVARNLAHMQGSGVLLEAPVVRHRFLAFAHRHLKWLCFLIGIWADTLS